MREAQQRIDSREFAEWMAYYQLEPWGRETQEIGRMLAMYHNVHRAQDVSPISDAEMIPGLLPPEPEQEQSVDRISRMLSLFAGVPDG